jgi:hypothetical protein
MTDVYQKVREGHRFDLLETGFQSATERNSEKKRSSINFGQIFDLSFSKGTEASY